jgi:hypothetical protein
LVNVWLRLDLLSSLAPWRRSEVGEINIVASAIGV